MDTLYAQGYEASVLSSGKTKDVYTAANIHQTPASGFM
jgi:hypothetical protein